MKINQSAGWKRLGIEFLGTYFWALMLGMIIVGISLYSEFQTLYIPFGIGVTVAVMYGVFPGQFNPAVTFGLWVIKRIRPVEAIMALVGQIGGAYAGLYTASLLVGSRPEAPSAVTNGAFAGEFLGTLVIALVLIKGVVEKRSPEKTALLTGLAVAVGMSVGVAVSGGIVNPAIALALGSYHFSYLLAPFLAGGVAAGLVVLLEPMKVEK